MISDDELKKIMPNCPSARRAEYLPFIQQAMQEFEITTHLRKAAFLAQLAHESGELKFMEELASGAAYEGRTDLGNTQKGDGKRYKGRGPIQLTGRANYQKFGPKLGLDLVNNPTIAATKEVGFRIAGLFWVDRGLNALADKGSQIVSVTRTRKNRTTFVEQHPAFDAITFRINGGFNGQEDRIKYYERAKNVLSKDEASDDTAAVPVATDAPASGGQVTAFPNSVLREGSKGPDVELLQRRLSELGFSVGIDGNFGPGTAKAVIAFQQANGLKGDGVVGPNTWSALATAQQSAAGS